MSTSPPQCWSCRRRRVRCDAEKPTCKKCKAKNIECLGYGEKPLVWVKGPHARNRRPKAQEKTNSSNVAIARRERSQETLGSVQEWGSQLFPQGQANLVRCIEYYNRNVCSGMSPVASSANPFRIDEKWEYSPQVLFDCIIPLVARHRITRLRCTSTKIEWTEDVQSLEEDVSKHTVSAVTNLNMMLSSPKFQKSFLTLILVFMLLTSEVQRCSYGPKWKMHLEGARAIVNLHGGMANLLEVPNPAVRNFMSYLILCDMMRITTCDVREEPQALEQIKYLNFIPALFNDGVWTVMPCPEALLRRILLVNDLRAQAAHTKFSVQKEATKLEARDLLIDLVGFDPGEWAASAMLIQEKSPRLKASQWNTRVCEIPPLKSQIQPSSPSKSRDAKMWHCLGIIYKSAVMLYLIRGLLLSHFDQSATLLAESTATLHDLRLEYVRNLRENLDTIFETRNTNISFYLFAFWPMFMVGLEIGAKDHEGQALLLRRLNEMAVVLGFNSLIDASEFLKRYWKRGLGPSDTTVDWDDLFFGEQPCLFVF